MKVKIQEISGFDHIEVEIKCSKITSEVKNIERLLSLYYLPLQGKRNDRFYPLILKDIYYFDALDHDVFAYTRDEIYEVSFKLYQLEENYQTLFLRVNKNTLVNPKMIKSFKSSINGRMEAELLNGDKIIISRMYVKGLKQLLGGAKL
jgi:DNA-binding LytR/AlgR family response regulator